MFVNHNPSFDQISAENKSPSPDGRWVVAFWLAQHREDRYEDVSDYTIAVFNAITHQPVMHIFRREDVDYEHGVTRGEAVHSAVFSEDGKYVLINGGTTEEDRVPFKPTPR